MPLTQKELENNKEKLSADLKEYNNKGIGPTETTDGKLSLSTKIWGLITVGLVAALAVADYAGLFEKLAN